LRYGAAKGKDGLVILTTLGTGIGIALLHNGVLIPNASWATSSSTATTPRPAPRPAPSVRA
jgi:predicted NBD/HSP70 family sugar kinase